MTEDEIKKAVLKGRKKMLPWLHIAELMGLPEKRVRRVGYELGLPARFPNKEGVIFGMTEDEVRGVIPLMRAEGKSWQAIATATRRHPLTVREMGVAMGLPVHLPGARTPPQFVGGWTRHKAILARQAELPPEQEPIDRGYDYVLPPGHHVTWGAISSTPWATVR